MTYINLKNKTKIQHKSQNKLNKIKKTYFLRRIKFVINYKILKNNLLNKMTLQKELFKNNLEWISKFPIIILELHDWMMPKQANSTNFLKAISDHDRDFVFMGENVFSISNTQL